MENILTKAFDTPFGTTPFERITPEDFLPAITQLISVTTAEIEKIATNPKTANYENTIEALAYSGKELNTVSSIFFNLNSAETTDRLQDLAQQISPLLTEFSSKITQNEQLFARIYRVHKLTDRSTLDKEQQMLLDETYKEFIRSGAKLSSEQKKELELINKDIAKKSLQFGQNLLAATNQYFKHIKDEEELKGVPEGIKFQFAEEAKTRGLDGYVITLDYPSYLPAMMYLEDRNLRMELALANGRKAAQPGMYDNRNLIRELTVLRSKKAILLGYRNYAEYVLEERMAKSPATVENFLHELREKATPFAYRDVEEIQRMAKADGIKQVETWDHSYYAEKIKKERFDINDEELRPYLPLKSVEKALFTLINTLFGLEFIPRTDIEVYHKEVQVYEVREQGSYKAILYTDYHPRKGKRAGAWMTSYQNQYIENGENHRPHISVVCNFTKPTAQVPSLLTFQEVTTLFHEFGHALHGMLANTRYPSLSGTNVKWDFVELPSQFMENFCYEPDFLQSFAFHYRTGEPLPLEKISKITQSKNFMEGYQTLRQIGFGLLDMGYHQHNETIGDIREFELLQTASTQVYPIHSDMCTSTSFSHIFHGGYASGYYSYKWAEVLDADAFDHFKSQGLYDISTAKKFKTLLSKGGSEDPMQLYIEFKGDEPTIDSLMKRAFGQ